MKNKIKKAVGYIRRSNHNEAARGSFDRQEKAVTEFAKRSGFEIVEGGFYHDGGISGTTSLEERDGMLALLERCKADGITVAIVQECGRLARQLLCQMLIIDRFKSAGIELLDCTGLKLSETDDPQRKMVIQILGAIKEMDRSETIAKMKAGKERKRKLGFRVEGRARFGAESPVEATIIKRIRQVRRSHGNAKGKPLNWVKVTGIINDEGHRNRKGDVFTAAYVRKLARENGIT
jgi:DNA invertase Pin-like site-specific DNA recombinase